MRKLMFIGFGFAIVVAFAQDKKVPIKATIHTTYSETAPDGSMSSYTRVEKYYRNVDGSTLICSVKNNAVDGPPLVCRLSDVGSRQSFTINYEKRTYWVMPRAFQPRKPATVNPSLPKQVVNGVACSVVPVGPDRRSGEFGSSCYSTEYGLMIQSTNEEPTASGVGRTVIEYSDIGPDIIRDASFFQVPADFTLGPIPYDVGHRP